MTEQPQEQRPDTYIVVNKETGEAVCEFFTEKLKRHINQEKYKVMIAREYLPTLNQRGRG